MRAALAPLLLVAHAAAAATPSLEGIVDRRLKEATSPVCVAVGVVGEERRTALRCSAGAGKATFDARSIFPIGSVTKGLTGLLLADMVVRGEVALDDPASKYARPGAKLPAWGGREIRLRDLVTHTSGLPRTPPGFESRDPSNPYADFDADALYASLAQAQLARDIGSRYEYSNMGFMWLSELLARRAGKSFERLMTERIFLPLGMRSTRIRLSRDDEARLVKGHDASYAIVPRWTIGNDLEGVGLVASSLDDMMRLAEALAGLRSTPLDAAIALAVQPPSSGTAPDVGFAWNIRGDGASRRYDHGGGAGGFVAHVTFERTRKTASVVLADAAVSIFDLSIHLVDASYHLRRRPVTVPLEAARRADYAGSFTLGFGEVNVRDDGGRLIAAVGPQLVIELLHMGDDAFYSNAVDAQVFYKRGRDGKVDGLTLYLDGRDSRGVRRPGGAR